MKLMNVMEPITEENFKYLRPGEWIWDNKRVRKVAHGPYSYSGPIEYTYEPVGFRQIHRFLDDKESSCMFMLTNFASQKAAHTWEHCDSERFFKFKWDMLERLGKRDAFMDVACEMIAERFNQNEKGE